MSTRGFRETRALIRQVTDGTREIVARKTLLEYVDAEKNPLREVSEVCPGFLALGGHSTPLRRGLVVLPKQATLLWLVAHLICGAGPSPLPQPASPGG